MYSLQRYFEQKKEIKLSTTTQNPVPSSLAAQLNALLTQMVSLVLQITQQEVNSANSLSAIPNPITLAAAQSLAQAKGWTITINLNVNPATISFFFNVGGMGPGLVATVNLST